MTVWVLESEGRRRRHRNDEYHHAPRLFAGQGFIRGEDRRVGPEGVFVEQDGEVRVAGVRNGLVCDVRNVVTGFLKDDCMKSSAFGSYDLCGIPGRWSWIPLQNGAAILMMLEGLCPHCECGQVQHVLLVQN